MFRPKRRSFIKNTNEHKRYFYATVDESAAAERRYIAPSSRIGDNDRVQMLRSAISRSFRRCETNQTDDHRTISSHVTQQFSFGNIAKRRRQQQ